MVDTLRIATLMGATVAMGLLAGVFYAFTVSVMPGLRQTDDRAFVDTMQRINVAIMNPWFLASFGGAPLLTAVAAGLVRTEHGGDVLGWILAALVLAAVGFIITVRFNVPLNDAIDAAGPPDQIADPAAVRERFESPWVRWNLARAVAHTGSFGALTWALVLYGRGP